MTKLSETLHSAIAALPAERKFALVGGLAVSVRAEPRFTRDVDLAVAVASDAEAEEVVFALHQRGFVVQTTVEHEKQSRLATARLRRDPRAPIIDLLFASSGIEGEIAAAAESLTVLGAMVPVAVPGHLIAMKLLSREPARPRDEQDLVELARIATSEDWDVAGTAVELIARRGYARNRDLTRDVGVLRRQFGR